MTKLPFTAVALLLLTGLFACSDKSGDSPRPELPELPDVVDLKAPEAGEARPRREVALVLTGEVRGEIEPCGCPTLPYGGFARRQTMLGVLERQGVALVQLDAGDALLKGISAKGRVDTLERGELVLGLMRELGVDAMAPGVTDLKAVGLDGLRAAERRGIPMVSATWLDADGAPIFAPWRVIETETARIGVIGLSAPVDSLKQRDPVEAARAAVAEMPDDLDLVVALGNVRAVWQNRVAEAVDGVDLVLGTQGADLQEYRVQGQTPVVEAPDRGRFLSVVHLSLQSDRAQPVRAEEALSDLLEQRAKMRAQGARVEPDSEAGIRASSRLVELNDELDERGAGLNLLHLVTQPLGSELDAPGSARERVDAFKAERVAEARKAAASVPKPDHTFATSGACASCHPQQLARWAFTGHSRATTTLIGQDKADDPECLGCHTTAFGEAGGFAPGEPSALKVWGGVQCEECHGPMGGHPRDDSVTSQAIDAEVCTECHDAANSPNFEMESYLRETVCPPMTQ